MKKLFPLCHYVKNIIYRGEKDDVAYKHFAFLGVTVTWRHFEVTLVCTSYIFPLIYSYSSPSVMLHSGYYETLSVRPPVCLPVCLSVRASRSCIILNTLKVWVMCVVVVEMESY